MAEYIRLIRPQRLTPQHYISFESELRTTVQIEIDPTHHWRRCGQTIDIYIYIIYRLNVYYKYLSRVYIRIKSKSTQSSDLRLIATQHKYTIHHTPYGLVRFHIYRNVNANGRRACFFLNTHIVYSNTNCVVLFSPLQCCSMMMIWGENDAYIK